MRRSGSPAMRRRTSPTSTRAVQSGATPFAEIGRRYSASMPFASSVASVGKSGAKDALSGAAAAPLRPGAERGPSRTSRASEVLPRNNQAANLRFPHAPTFATRSIRQQGGYPACGRRDFRVRPNSDVTCGEVAPGADVGIGPGSGRSSFCSFRAALYPRLLLSRQPLHSVCQQFEGGFGATRRCICDKPSLEAVATRLGPDRQ
jgi:hypothetical protein